MGTHLHPNYCDGILHRTLQVPDVSGNPSASVVRQSLPGINSSRKPFLQRAKTCKTQVIFHPRSVLACPRTLIEGTKPHSPAIQEMLSMRYVQVSYQQVRCAGTLLISASAALFWWPMCQVEAINVWGRAETRN